MQEERNEYGEFIIESIEYPTESVSSTGINKNTLLKLKGIFSIADKKNTNGRLYPTSVWKKEVEAFKEKIKKGQALGKTYHPPATDSGAIHGLSGIAHRITDISMEGNTIRGELVVLNTKPDGENVKAIIDGGGTVGISSRGWSSPTTYYEKYITESGEIVQDVNVMNSDYKCVAFDLVLDPGFETALLQKVESKESKGKKEMTIEELKTQHKELVDMVAEETKKSFENEIEGLKKSLIVEENSNKDLVGAVDKLKLEAESLKREKTQLGILNIVKEVIESSSFKEYFTKGDIQSVCEKASSVEEAKAEVNARIELIKSISESVNKKGTLKARGVSEDTSEAEVGNKQEIVETFKKLQRQMAFNN